MIKLNQTAIDLYQSAIVSEIFIYFKPFDIFLIYNNFLSLFFFLNLFSEQNVMSLLICRLLSSFDISLPTAFIGFTIQQLLH